VLWIKDRTNPIEEEIMSLFTVDPDKCKRDGICAEVCPFHIIDFSDREAVPKPVQGAEEECFNCGQCMSACPYGALDLTSMPMPECTPMREEFSLNIHQVDQFLRGRRSCRVYKDEIVPRETLEQLIGMAGYAPSGHNTQPTSWLVIYDKDEVRKLAGLTVEFLRTRLESQPDFARSIHMDTIVDAWDEGSELVFRGAPHVIIAHAHKDERTAPIGCVIAQAYLELAANALGLGACWAGYFNVASLNYPPLQDALQLPEGHQNFGALMIGYPKYKYHRIPLRNAPRITWRW
jgi:nitroreductase/NAD-dependent dihydropyrimidine dehydrogenase PreA subunit